MPTALGVLEGKPVLVLSGNPVAALIGFEVFGRALISRLLGMHRTEPQPMLNATLAGSVVNVLEERPLFESA